ncbi:MAG: PIG-L family deacetylase [Acidobacteria bacterium]|nr:PIG-L family deacetylase [Acidobacteriota bacterium]
MRVDLATPGSALAIAAHPDDVEFNCGGTLAKWAAQGVTVHHLICTDGSKGTWDPNENLDVLVDTRVVEQRSAAAALGASGDVVMLGRTDGELTSDAGTVEEIALWIRRLRPEVVFGHDPWKRWRLHPDHRAAGQLVCDGVVAARDPHFFAHQDEPHHRPDALLLFETDEPNHYEQIETGAKIAALLEHRSQFVTTMQIDDPDDISQRDAFAAIISGEARKHGRSIGVRFAEPFRSIAT